MSFYEFSELDYYVSKRGFATISGIGDDFEGSILKIPATINKTKVYAVDEYAFEDDCTIKLLVVAEGVKAIYSGAFCYASALKKVYLPSSLSILGDCAFVDSPSITDIVFKRNKLITEIQHSTFAGITKLRRILLPTNLSVIGEYAFFKCTSLPEIELPATMTRIEECAFLECKSLESIKIPANVTFIGESAFLGCKNLTEMHFEECDGWFANGKRVDYAIMKDPAAAAKLFTNPKSEYVTFTRRQLDEWI